MIFVTYCIFTTPVNLPAQIKGPPESPWILQFEAHVCDNDANTITDSFTISAKKASLESPLYLFLGHKKSLVGLDISADPPSLTPVLDNGQGH